jgi:hypothetical protein
MKSSSRDQQLGLASPLNYAAIQSSKTKTPLRRRRNGQGLDASHAAFREGRGEYFSLDILSHRMSDMAMFRQADQTGYLSERRENRLSSCPTVSHMRGESDAQAYFSIAAGCVSGDGYIVGRD